MREKDDLLSEISGLESSLNVLKISRECRFFYFTLINVVKHKKGGR